MQAQRIDPAEALRIHWDIGARQSLDVQWGRSDGRRRARRGATRAGARRDAGMDAAEFCVLRMGESRRIAH